MGEVHRTQVDKAVELQPQSIDTCGNVQAVKVNTLRKCAAIKGSIPCVNAQGIEGWVHV